jgi:hypothetical protein
MDEKKETRLSERIWIWMHNESVGQKFTEENPQDLLKEQRRK